MVLSGGRGVGGNFWLPQWGRFGQGATDTQEVQEAAKSWWCTGQPPPPRIIWPKMPMVKLIQVGFGGNMGKWVQEFPKLLNPEMCWTYHKGIYTWRQGKDKILSLKWEKSIICIHKRQGVSKGQMDPDWRKSLTAKSQLSFPRKWINSPHLSKGNLVRML